MKKKYVIIIVFFICSLILGLGLGLGLGLKKKSSSSTEPTKEIISQDSKVRLNYPELNTSDEQTYKIDETTQPIITTGSTKDILLQPTTTTIKQTDTNNTSIVTTQIKPIVTTQIKPIVTTQIKPIVTTQIKQNSNTITKPYITTRIIPIPTTTLKYEPPRIPIQIVEFINNSTAILSDQIEYKYNIGSINKKGKLIKIEFVGDIKSQVNGATCKYMFGIKDYLELTWKVKKELTKNYTYIPYSAPNFITNVTSTLIPSSFTLIENTDKAYIGFDKIPVENNNLICKLSITNLKVKVYIDPNITSRIQEPLIETIKPVSPIQFNPIVAPNIEESYSTLDFNINKVTSNVFDRIIIGDITKIGKLFNIQVSGYASDQNIGPYTASYTLGIWREDNWLISKKIYFNSQLRINSPFRFDITPTAITRLRNTDKLILELNAITPNSKIELSNVIIKVNIIFTPILTTSPSQLSPSTIILSYDIPVLDPDYTDSLTNQLDDTIRYLGVLNNIGRLVYIKVSCEAYNYSYNDYCAKFQIGIKRNYDILIFKDTIIDTPINKFKNFTILPIDYILLQPTDIIYIKLIYICPQAHPICLNSCKPTIHNLIIKVYMDTNYSNDTF